MDSAITIRMIDLYLYTLHLPGSDLLLLVFVDVITVDGLVGRSRMRGRKNKKKNT